ncbi:sporulation protein [Hahella sp. CCB-MM4]|uniref:SPOR domain-containing protein n=1 Tax=Hahella sp. (strain CCB-MM4) TaxID=1926491 RepID=UPI000B9A96B9|nr:SPOR domain-containing protein [Hahella sp. CCB-MM4]OZG71428.1 sporulation protein [Hahella sp. CCB-MM4]
MAKKSSTSTQKKVPGWVWAFNLALAALFLYFLYYLKSVPETRNVELPADTASQQPPTNTAPAKSEDTDKNDQRFKFYDMLPETKVVAPKVEEYTPKKLPENVAYMLQTGSFRAFDDAERQRAMIGFQGLKAQVEKFQASEDSIWYRVQVGPFSSRSKMNSAVDKLVAINIQPLVKTLKTEGE